MPWRVESVTQQANAAVTITLKLVSNACSKVVWPHDFELRYTVTFAEALAMALEVRHTGSGGSGFTYEAALHT